MSALAASSLVRLLWLASPALPIGSYAYSRGLEQAVAGGIVHHAASLSAWIEGILRAQLVTLDAPLLLRVHAAARADDGAAIQHWSELLTAFRETRELSLEDAQMGGSLTRLMRELGIPGAAHLPARAGHAAAFAVAAAHHGLTGEQAVAAYLFAFAENQVTCALKCMQMGQTAGQHVLHAAMLVVDQLVPQVLAVRDDELGSYAPGLAMLSALHETQYSRLFRS